MMGFLLSPSFLLGLGFLLFSKAEITSLYLQRFLVAFLQIFEEQPRNWTVMAKSCHVLAGVWKCCDDGSWDFVIDKGKMSGVVSIEESLSFEDVREIVTLEFGEETVVKTVLSYWLPVQSESGICPRTSPVLIRTHAGFKAFVRGFFRGEIKNMCVTFSSGEDDSSFRTPEAMTKARSVLHEKEKGVSFSPMENVGFQSSSKVGTEEVTPEWLKEVEIVEEHLRSAKRCGTKDINCSSGAINLNFSDGEDDDADGVEVSDMEAVDVRPRGYDKDFWEPLIEEPCGGSNAYEYMSYTNNAFDHMVVGRGKAVMVDDPKEECSGMRFPNLDFLNCGRQDMAGSSGTKRVAHATGSRFGVGGGTRVNSLPERNLADIDDEEFDIPPLVDDLSYEIADIPDLENDDLDDEIYVGKTYASKADCQIALAIYAIKQMFHFRQSRTKKNYFVVTCSDTKCNWRVSAHELRDSGYYQIRKAILGHTCSIETRSKFKKKATSKVIAALYKSRFNDVESGPKPLDVQQLVLEELRISTTYFKCWKAKETAYEGLRGNDEDSYLNLGAYLHMLTRANPGTRAEIETEGDGEGGERFLYMYIAFGASIEGFKYLRPVLVLDGTHLGGKYKGVLLTASGQDANFQVFPLAFGVVDSENDAAWTWFLTKVERIIADSPSLSIILDKHNSINKALKSVFPRAHHGACIMHLSRNVVAHFKSKGLAKLVVQAACAYKVGQFRTLFAQIENSSSECAKYLQKIGFAHWARCHFRGEWYNLMTTNIAETLNSALRKRRKSPITELLMFIQSMLTRWFSARRKKSQGHEGFVTPEVDKVITSNLGLAKGSRLVSISSWSYEVVGVFGKKNNVELQQKRCTCKVYDRTKISCGHAILAGDVKGVPYGKLTGDYYRTGVWAKTYAGVVKPHEDPRDYDLPPEVTNIIIFPPKTRRPSGRPKEKRIPSIGEITDGRTSTSKVNNRCGRCKGYGHNRVSCTNPI